MKQPIPKGFLLSSPVHFVALGLGAGLSPRAPGTVYQGKEKGQSFGKVSNAFIRAVDARGKEICRYNISGDASYSQYRSMTFAQVSRQGGAWEFRAIGTPHETDRFVNVLKNYI